MDNIQFNPGEKVRFIKAATVYSNVDNTSFEVAEGTLATVVEDKDIGEVGKIKLRLFSLAGETDIEVFTDDQNLEKV